MGESLALWDTHSVRATEIHSTRMQECMPSGNTQTRSVRGPNSSISVRISLTLTCPLGVDGSSERQRQTLWACLTVEMNRGSGSSSPAGSCSYLSRGKKEVTPWQGQLLICFASEHPILVSGPLGQVYSPLLLASNPPGRDTAVALVSTAVAQQDHGVHGP